MTGAEALAALRTQSDRLGVADGRLTIGGQDAAALLREYGSPLFVAVEDSITANYRRLRDAFGAAWPEAVTVMFAVKTNNTLAIRALLSREGAGGDCFGAGELHACLATGTDPARMVLNGSNKGAEEIAIAIRDGIRINIDSEDEIGLIESLAPPGRRVRVNLRLKPLPPEIDRFSAAFFKRGGGMLDAVKRTKWGFSRAAAARLVPRLRASPHLELEGYSCHVGRFSADPDSFAVVAAELGRDVVRLHAETGFWPSTLDIGGGWPRQREPESRAPDLNPHPIETYADRACAALLAELIPSAQPVPALWLEPGRYLVGNGVVLLATVGAIRKDLDHVWIHADASTDLLMRAETSAAWYHILPAGRMDAPFTQTADIVGSTCVPSILGAGREMPELAPGDAIAVLDAGMYAEVLAAPFNAVGRPASVMVSPGGVHLTRRRETIADIFARDRVPAHLEAPHDG